MKKAALTQRSVQVPTAGLVEEREHCVCILHFIQTLALLAVLSTATILKKATAKWRCEGMRTLSLLDEICHFKNKAGPQFHQV